MTELEKQIAVAELREIAKREEFESDCSNGEFTKGYGRGLKWGETYVARKALKIIESLPLIF